MKTIRFFKSVGGYMYCVLVRGRWHYVGDTRADGSRFQDYYLARGYQLERVRGIPPAIAKHFRTLATLKAGLPQWTPE